jgi:3-hydroxybutyryl-CoA dehydratase
MAGKSRFVGKIFLPNCEKHQEKRFYFLKQTLAKGFPAARRWEDYSPPWGKTAQTAPPASFEQNRSAGDFTPPRNALSTLSDGKAGAQTMAEIYFFEDLTVGLTAKFSKTITEADIVLFAAVTGDTNPMHLDAEYAATSIFKERIAHGMLAAGLITKVLGTQLPGPGTIYMSQTLKFRAPVKIGETVTAIVEVAALHPEKHRATLKTVCLVKGEPVLEGEAYVSVPSRAAITKAAE